MMNHKVMILIFFICSGKILSQGFDWQYSARLPFEVPNFFIGLDGSASMNINSTDFNICDNNIPCDTFNTGSGIGFSGGIKFEYWANFDVSYFTNISISYKTESFKNENLFYYLPEIGNKILEYEYIRKEYIPELEFGIKYRMRFLLPHLFSALSFNTGFIVSTEEELILRKVSTADWLAEEIHFKNFQALDLSSVIFTPHIKIGYDFNTGLGSFSSFYFDIGIPFQNRYSAGKWQTTTFSAGVSIFPFGL